MTGRIRSGRIPIGADQNLGKPSICRIMSTPLPSPRMESRLGTETHRKASRGCDGLAAEARSRLSSAPNSRSTRFSRRIGTGSSPLGCDAIPVREKWPRSAGSRPARRFPHPQPHTDRRQSAECFADSFHAAIDGSWTAFVDAIDTTGASGATAGEVLDL